MQLNLGNATKQDHDFTYRLPNNPMKIVVRTIPKGSQIDIQGDKDELENIIAQYERFGLVEVRECAKTPKFSGLVFSFNGKINMDKLGQAREAHGDFIDQNAQEIREATAAAVAGSIDGEASAVGANVGKTTMDIEELPGAGSEGKKKTHVTLIADKSAPEKVSHRRRQAVN